MNTLRTKRIYEPAEPEDGLRILVDRLWPRGVSKSTAAVDLWRKEIAPSNELRKWYGHRPERWMGFVVRYFQELDQKPEVIRELKRHIAARSVTLLYSAKDTRRNQAAALLAYLRKDLAASADVVEARRPVPVQDAAGVDEGGPG
jgi:uncharacterized protein YeaO (DUF488 family)